MTFEIIHGFDNLVFDYEIMLKNMIRIEMDLECEVG